MSAALPSNPSDLRPAIDLKTAALFFDVDGTLLELRPHPHDVMADPELVHLIERLHGRTGGAVALVSGRALADLDRIFAPLTLPAGALHGAEIRYPDGTIHSANPKIMDHARPQAMQFVADNPGLFLEDKGATLAIHFRQRPGLGPTVLNFLSGFSPSDDVAVQEGKLVFELKPSVFDKGCAIESLLAYRPFAGRIPYFFGDDLTDEAGFLKVNELGGRSIRIGARETPTHARMHLPDETALRAHLSDWLESAQEAP